MAPKKTRNIGLRVSDEEKAELEHLAEAAGLPLSEYLRRSARDRAEAVLSPRPTLPPAPPASQAPSVTSSPAPAASEAAWQREKIAPYVCHVDNLGDDPLRVDTGALTR